MLEDTEVQEGQIESATAEATPAGTEELAGKGTEATNAVPEGDISKETKSPSPDIEQEVMFEVAGKSYTMKQAQIVEALEKAHAIAEREKSIAEKEKSLNKDYTQKSQANAQFRKSIETTFGRFPEQGELQALGKIWKSYFSSPQVKQVIDGILSGRIDVGNGSGQGQPRDPYIQQLEQKIAELEERHNSFATSFEERQQMAQEQESQKLWSTWVKSKDSQGIKITDEIDRKMSPFVSALRQAMPDATAEQILDEAYKHATIDQLKQDVAKQTLVSADKAKKQGIIKITPKGGAKSDESKSYREMLLESA